jgi:hypothetical protein
MVSSKDGVLFCCSHIASSAKRLASGSRREGSRAARAAARAKESSAAVSLQKNEEAMVLE